MVGEFPSCQVVKITNAHDRVGLDVDASNDVCLRPAKEEEIRSTFLLMSPAIVKPEPRQNEWTRLPPPAHARAQLIDSRTQQGQRHRN